MRSTHLVYHGRVYRGVRLIDLDDQQVATSAGERLGERLFGPAPVIDLIAPHLILDILTTGPLNNFPADYLLSTVLPPPHACKT